MPALTIMPSTYLSLHYHLVFSTKNRETIIAPEWRARLHDYLGGTVRGLGGFPEATQKGNMFPGEHQAIVPRELCDRVHTVPQVSPWVRAIPMG